MTNLIARTCVKFITALIAASLAVSQVFAQTKGDSMITITTNHGTITAELFDEAAPETVANFKRYIESGFYDGTIFHRVIPGFMIQGGGFTTDMEQNKNE